MDYTHKWSESLFEFNQGTSENWFSLNLILFRAATSLIAIDETIFFVQLINRLAYNVSHDRLNFPELQLIYFKGYSGIFKCNILVVQE